jgi:hypothetical protein
MPYPADRPPYGTDTAKVFSELLCISPTDPASTLVGLLKRGEV